MATTCAISRAEFKARAKAVTVTVEYEGVKVTRTILPREFETGSLGWNLNDKTVFTMDGRDVTLQLGANFTLVGSKLLPKA